MLLPQVQERHLPFDAQALTLGLDISALTGHALHHDLLVKLEADHVFSGDNHQPLTYPEGL